VLKKWSHRLHRFAQNELARRLHRLVLNKWSHRLHRFAQNELAAGCADLC